MTNDGGKKLSVGSGAICVLNPYRTAMYVYYDKTSDSSEELDNESMRRGRESEEYVVADCMSADELTCQFC